MKLYVILDVLKDASDMVTVVNSFFDNPVTRALLEQHRLWLADSGGVTVSTEPPQPTADRLEVVLAKLEAFAAVEHPTVGNPARDIEMVAGRLERYMSANRLTRGTVAMDTELSATTIKRVLDRVDSVTSSVLLRIWNHLETERAAA